MTITFRVRIVILAALVAIAGAGENRNAVRAAEVEGSAEVLPAIRAKLKSEVVNARRLAVERIGAMGPAAAGAAGDLADALKSDSDVMVRTRAAWALGEIGGAPETCVPALIAGFSDDEAAVRANASLAMVRLGPAAVPALRGLLEAEGDDTPGIAERRSAITVLARVDPEGSAPLIVPAAIHLLDEVEASDAETRSEIAQALMALGPLAAPAVPALTTLLSDASGVVRGGAVRALGAIGREAAPSFPQVVERLKGDSDRAVRVSAAVVLPDLGEEDPDAVTTALIAAFDDKEKRVRYAAGLNVARLGSRIVPALLEAAASETPSQRLGAMETLAHLGPAGAGAVDAAIACLNDAEWETRGRAADALAAMAQPSGKVLEALTRVAESEDERVSVKAHARSALDALGRVSSGDSEVDPSGRQPGAA